MRFSKLPRRWSLLKLRFSCWFVLLLKGRVCNIVGSCVLSGSQLLVLLLRPKPELQVRRDSTDGELRVQRKCHNDGQQGAHIRYMIKTWPCGLWFLHMSWHLKYQHHHLSLILMNYSPWAHGNWFPFLARALALRNFASSSVPNSTHPSFFRRRPSFSLSKLPLKYSRNNEKWKQPQVQRGNAGWVNFERFMRCTLPACTSHHSCPDWHPWRSR